MDGDQEVQDYFAARLTPLETKLAYLEDFVASLQEVTAEHSALIDSLKKENRRLYDKLIELEESGKGSVADGRPPHY